MSDVSGKMKFFTKGFIFSLIQFIDLSHQYSQIFSINIMFISMVEF
jgi:hypothetical protein